MFKPKHFHYQWERIQYMLQLKKSRFYTIPVEIFNQLQVLKILQTTRRIYIRAVVGGSCVVVVVTVFVTPQTETIEIHIRILLSWLSWKLRPVHGHNSM